MARYLDINKVVVPHERFRGARRHAEALQLSGAAGDDKTVGTGGHAAYICERNAVALSARDGIKYLHQPRAGGGYSNSITVARHRDRADIAAHVIGTLQKADGFAAPVQPD